MMRPTNKYSVFGFASTHDALEAESVLNGQDVDVVPIPAPPSVSASCGIALRVLFDQTDIAERYLLEAGLAPQAKVQIEDF